MLRIVVCVVLLFALLVGCAAPSELETVNDQISEPQIPAAQVRVELPEGAVLAVFENDDAARLYLCQGYEISVQTLPGGDLNETLQTVTGYSRDKLTVIERQWQGMKRMDLAWATAGETGDQVGRIAILDDGTWHYVLSVLGDAASVETMADDWEAIFRSFAVVSIVQ